MNIMTQLANFIWTERLPIITVTMVDLITGTPSESGDIMDQLNAGRIENPDMSHVQEGEVTEISFTNNAQ